MKRSKLGKILGIDIEKPIVSTLLMTLVMILAVSVAPVMAAGVTYKQDGTIYSPKAVTSPRTAASVPTGTCGPIDLAVVLDDTGSMGGAISNIVAELPTLAATANTASGGDLHIGFVTFRDTVEVKEPLRTDPGLTNFSGLVSLETANGGGDFAEPSDEAKNTVVNNLNTTPRADAKGFFGSQMGDFSPPWRSSALKLAVLITDATSNGFSETFPNPGGFSNGDPAYVAKMASLGTDAGTKGIKFFDVFVPTGYDIGQVSSMTADAVNSGGEFLQVAQNGTGTGAAINSILSTCGHPSGIALTPETATNPTGTNHTVTATVKDTTGAPQVGVTITFLVVSGPNNGKTGNSVTDGSGQASWTYTGTGGAGTDKIQASFTDTNGKTVNSNVASKDWTVTLAANGSISGTKYNDLNRNGKRDTGEPGLASWTITLTNSTGSVSTMVTDANGNYIFANLTDGSYTVKEVNQSGWTRTEPATGEYSVTITGEATITGKDFGNVQTVQKCDKKKYDDDKKKYNNDMKKYGDDTKKYNNDMKKIDNDKKNKVDSMSIANDNKKISDDKKRLDDDKKRLDDDKKRLDEDNKCKNKKLT